MWTRRTAHALLMVLLLPSCGRIGFGPHVEEARDGGVVSRPDEDASVDLGRAGQLDAPGANHPLDGGVGGSGGGPLGGAAGSTAAADAGGVPGSPDASTNADARVPSPDGQAVDAPAGCLVVTTPEDEEDAGERPQPTHLGTGLSLREALTLAQAQAGGSCITFDRAMTIRPTRNLPAGRNGGPPVGVHGRGIVVLDGALNRDNPAFVLSFASDNNRISDLTVTGLPDDVTSTCLQVKTAGNTLGPNLIVHGCGQGVLLEGANNTITASTFFGNGEAVKIRQGSPAAVVVRNLFRNNTGNGIQIVADATGSVFRHNVFHANAAGMVIKGVAGQMLVQNNVFSNCGTAIDSNSSASFTVLDHNDYFGNTSNCRDCTPGGNALYVDPRFVAPAAGDLHLRANSPVIDRGFDTGLDVNGSQPGRFNGAAPDMGAFEFE